MSWDERLFGWAYGRFRELGTARLRSAGELPTLQLSTVAKRLSYIATALAEEVIEVRSSDAWGGMVGSLLYLPSEISLLPPAHLGSGPDRVGGDQGQLETLAELPYFYYLWRTLTQCLAKKELQWRDLPLTMELAQNWENKTLETYPSVAAQWARLRLCTPTAMQGRGGQLNKDLPSWLWGAPPRDCAKPNSLQHEVFAEPGEESRRSELKLREYAAATQDEAQRAEVKEGQESPLVHVFEKVLTAEEYSGGDRKMDGSDQMAEHGDALNELRLSHVVRTNKTADSLLKTDALVESTQVQINAAALLGARVYHYPEWFTAEDQYRRDWCRLFAYDLAPCSEGQVLTEFTQRKGRELRDKIASLVNHFSWLRRQLDGDELDLSAVVDRLAQSRAGGAMNDRVYRRRLQNEQDMAVLILVDTSLSTDSWVAGRRVMDVLQESLQILAIALEGVPGVGIYAFNSFTRQQARFFALKHFADEWESVSQKIAGLQPDGYTRMGAPLRHATQLLAQQSQRHKLLLLLSDAKPTDFDFYEGRHGHKDVRKSIREAQIQSIRVKVLTVSEKVLPDHLDLFGAGNSYYVKDAGTLSAAVVTIWTEALRRRGNMI